MHERRRPRHRSGFVRVELWLSLSTLQAALGHDRRGAAVHPPWPRWQLFMGRRPRRPAILENHVQGRNLKNRLVLHAHTSFSCSLLMAAALASNSRVDAIGWGQVSGLLNRGLST